MNHQFSNFAQWKMEADSALVCTYPCISIPPSIILFTTEIQSVKDLLLIIHSYVIHLFIRPCIQFQVDKFLQTSTINTHSSTVCIAFYNRCAADEFCVDLNSEPLKKETKALSHEHHSLHLLCAQNFINFFFVQIDFYNAQVEKFPHNTFNPEIIESINCSN